MIFIKILSLFKGIIFGGVASFFTIVILRQFGGILAGGGSVPIFNQPGIYYVSLIPFVIIFSILSLYFHNKKDISNKKLWLISFICTIIASLLIGTVGLYYAQVIDRDGSETIVTESVFTWGAITALILLPLTTSFSRLLIGIFRRYIL